MGLFDKVQYIEVELPFRLDNDAADIENDGISIEAYGIIDGVEKYFYISFMLKDVSMYAKGDYEEMRNLLKETEGKNIILKLKYKKGKIKNFKLDIKSLAKTMYDKRFECIEILCWGVGDKSSISN